MIMINKSQRIPGNPVYTRVPGTVPGYPGETSLSLSATQKKKKLPVYGTVQYPVKSESFFTYSTRYPVQ